LRREVWLAWWKGTEGSKLLEVFKTRTGTDDDLTKIKGLIAKLASTDSDTRDGASTELVTMGKKASSMLRRVINEDKPGASFAKKALAAIEKDTPNPLPLAAARMLALRKPEGMIDALLGYAPFAESDEQYEQIVDILARTAVIGTKGDEVLVKALKDKVADRRALAAKALCRGKATDHLAAVSALLKDQDTHVKLAAGQGLVEMGSKSGIPTLITLLSDLPLEQAWDLEEYLGRLAGDKTPATSVGADKDSRTKAVTAWQTWWKDNGKDVNLAKVDMKGPPSLFVITENYNPNKVGGKGRVLLVDNNGKVRREIGDLYYPLDAQLLRNGNILVVENNRITERTRDNKIVWDKYYASAFHAQRLRNGHTFIACRNQLLVVDKTGKQVFSHYYNQNSILAAKRFKDGSMAYVSYSGHYVRLNAKGEQAKTFNLTFFNISVTGADILPGDKVIVGDGRFNNYRVIQYDSAGKIDWEAKTGYPSIPFRLSNGNTILATHSNMQITEIDSKGKVVKEWKSLAYRPYRVTKSR